MFPREIYRFYRKTVRKLADATLYLGQRIILGNLIYLTYKGRKGIDKFQFVGLDLSIQAERDIGQLFS
jgi:hypothetical protein